MLALDAFAYSVFRHPELLKSERYQLTARALDMLEDSELPGTARATVERLVIGFNDPKTFMPPDREDGSEGDADA